MHSLYYFLLNICTSTVEHANLKISIIKCIKMQREIIYFKTFWSIVIYLQVKNLGINSQML